MSFRGYVVRYSSFLGFYKKEKNKIMIIKLNNRKVKLPDFLIVGAAKSGTTSLSKYLVEHPEIYIPKEKELHFFAFANSKPSYYKKHILGPTLVTNFNDYCKFFKDIGEDKVLGEASVTYLYSDIVDNVIKNIKKYYGDKSKNLKIIVILRNPIDRAFSQYITRISQQENLSFIDACTSWNKRKNKGWSIAYDYLGFSFYYYAIKEYMTNFNYTKVYLFEDLKDNPVEFIQDIFKFLDVDHSFVPSSLGKKYNVSKKNLRPKTKFHKLFYDLSVTYNPFSPLAKYILPKQVKESIKKKLQATTFVKPQMEPEAREYLRNSFKEDIIKLQDLIKRDLSHWLK